MVRVNKNRLADKDILFLLKRFDDTLANFDQKGVTIFMSELLGKEERLTIAKRLTTIILLHEGCSQYKVSRLLKLSHSTTKIIGDKLEKGAYNGIIKLLKKKRVDYIELLNTVDSILHLGGLLPRRIGLDRYRHL